MVTTTFAVLALLLTPSDSTRLPAAFKAVLENVLQRESAKIKVPVTDVYIDVASLTRIAGVPRTEAWDEVVRAGGPKARDRTSRSIWQCDPEAERVRVAKLPVQERRLSCLPVPEGKILVFGAMQARSGTTMTIGLEVSWSIWSEGRGHLLGVGSAYQAILVETRAGWMVQEIRQVPHFTVDEK